MAELRRQYNSFLSLNTEIIAVGPEPYDDFRDFWEKEKMPFIGLADHEHIASDLYNQEVSLLKMGRMPAFFIIDIDGIIRYIHKGKAMWDIPKTKDILDIIKKVSSKS